MGVRRNLWRSSTATLVAQGCVKLVSEYFQRWRFYNLSEQLILGLEHVYGKKVLFFSFFFFQFCVLCPLPLIL